MVHVVWLAQDLLAIRCYSIARFMGVRNSPQDKGCLVRLTSNWLGVRALQASNSATALVTCVRTCSFGLFGNRHFRRRRRPRLILVNLPKPAAVNPT